MIIRYSEKSQEAEVHSGIPTLYLYDDGTNEEVCECEFVATVQAEYDYLSSHRVRLDTNRNESYRSNPIWLTPDQARELASKLCFAANDAEQLNKDYPVES